MVQTTAVRERPILFGGRMVRAILEGWKTQTRRVVVAPRWAKAAAVECDHAVSPGETAWPWCNRRDGMGWWKMECPYGQPGDRLWVREAWACWGFWLQHQARAGVMYRADADEHEDAEVRDTHRWRPSIHMPRWASRITLEVTGVRVERVQDISDADAIAEGVVKVREGCYVVRGTAQDRAGLGHSEPATAFACAWNEINEARGYGWAENPWVWVVEFRVLNGGE